MADVIEILNKNPEVRELNQKFMQLVSDENITGEAYTELRTTFLMAMLLIDKDAYKAFAGDLYDKLREEN